jgi:hypothetical protein
MGGRGMDVAQSMDPNLARDVYAMQHARYLQKMRSNDPEMNNPFGVEPPVKKIRYIDEWMDLHFRLIQRLVEEPMFAQPKIGEPVIEVTVMAAILHGPWQHPYMNMIYKPFVRQYVDTEMVGETKKYREDADPHFPVWNDKILYMPRGAKVAQFEVLNGMRMPLVLGDCAFNTETLWKCAQDCGRFALNTPILYQGTEVGKLQLRFRIWDGMPLDEVNPFLGQLDGTVAGALDNEFMREFGPHGTRAKEGNPFPNASVMAGMTSMPVAYSGFLNPMLPPKGVGMGEFGWEGSIV